MLDLPREKHPFQRAIIAVFGENIRDIVFTWNQSHTGDGPLAVCLTNGENVNHEPSFGRIPGPGQYIEQYFTVREHKNWDMTSEHAENVMSQQKGTNESIDESEDFSRHA